MLKEIKNYLASVSIIVPTYNMDNNIGILIESLLNQDYPKDLVEIIIVDNNSTDRTREIVKQYPVSLLEEKTIQSSYAARNTGIKAAKNEIFVFIDSDCIASRQWIREGIKRIKNTDADLAGGHVEFYFSKKRTAAEYWDALTNMQTKFDIRDRKVAKTANLFVKAAVFDQIGPFPDWIKSGGDVLWTKRATDTDYSLVYASKAIVWHPARGLTELLRKQYRVGKGKAYIMIDQKEMRLRRLFSIFFSILPPSPFFVRNMIQQRGKEEMKRKFLEIWLVVYLSILVTNFSLSKSLTGALREKHHV